MIAATISILRMIVHCTAPNAAWVSFAYRSLQGMIEHEHTRCRSAFEMTTRCSAVSSQMPYPDGRQSCAVRSMLWNISRVGSSGMPTILPAIVDYSHQIFRVLHGAGDSVGVLHGAGELGYTTNPLRQNDLQNLLVRVIVPAALART